MKTKLSWLDRIMAAVTFAEADEHEAGRRFLHGTGCTSERKQEGRNCDPVLNRSCTELKATLN